VERNLGRIVINEVADAVMRNAAEFGPFSQSADGGFFTSRKNPAGAETNNVSELNVEAGR
jgi:hypothetical protein